jgi:TonB family protein
MAQAQEEPQPLDPARARPEEAEPSEPKRRSTLPLALLGSLAVHLLPLVVLLDWSLAPAETVQPIPVQLVVIEEPAPPPLPPLPAFEPPKQPGRLASDDMGDPTTKETPAPEQHAASDQPAAPPEQLAMAAEPPPPPPPPPKPAVKQATVRPPPAPRPPAYGQVPGPSATRDAYLAYCMALVRRHFDLLSPTFLAGRRGETELKLTVLDDGTIARISVARRSPFPDIDARIEQVVSAVGRFPPLPQWFQGAQISLILHVSYPDGL